jgi:hypothetical protein
MSDAEKAEARRYRAWRDGEVIVRPCENGGWEVRHRDSSHWDIDSWVVNASLDEAIDEALARRI